MDEAQALQVIDEIVREHDVVMKHESTGPRFSDDAGDIDLVTPPLEIPTHPSLSTSTEAEITAQQLRENVPTRKSKRKFDDGGRRGGVIDSGLDHQLTRYSTSTEFKSVQ